jgi:uncharacterized protein (TIGR03435 family)
LTAKRLLSLSTSERSRPSQEAKCSAKNKLTIRRAIKAQPVYVLTVGRNGPKLQESKLEEKDWDDPANRRHFGGTGQAGGIQVKAFDMAELVVPVSNCTDRLLIDRTGLTGLSDIKTDG